MASRLGRFISLGKENSVLFQLPLTFSTEEIKALILANAYFYDEVSHSWRVDEVVAESVLLATSVWKIEEN